MQNEEFDLDNNINKTADDFNLLFEDMKNEASHFRLKSIYSYDILDHPDYAKLRRIVKGIRKQGILDNPMNK